MHQKQQIIQTAFNSLNKKNHILAPSHDATITFPDFDPCKPVQVIARVNWPATVNMRSVILTHCIMDGDSIL